MDAALAEEFTEFMIGRWPSLVRFGHGLTGDLGMAEDLAQLALTRACVAWPRVRRADDLDAYVRSIMINSNRSRVRRRRVPEHLTAAPPDAGSARCAAPDQPGAVVGALMGLPIGQRAVLVLRYWMDLSAEETARTLGCSVGNVKSQASRGLAKLRLDPALASLGATGGDGHAEQ